MSEPLTDAQLAAIDADVELAHEGKLIGVPRGAERFEAAVRVADYHSRTLLAEVHRLRKAARDYDRSLDEVIGERDYAQSMADKLAAAIAPEDVLGEHSDGNFPWQNALDWAAEKERAFEALRKELADTAMMRDFYQRSADHIATNRAVAEAAIAKWERGDLASYDALQAIKKTLAVGDTEMQEQHSPCADPLCGPCSFDRAIPKETQR